MAFSFARVSNSWRNFAVVATLLALSSKVASAKLRDSKEGGLDLSASCGFTLANRHIQIQKLYDNGESMNPYLRTRNLTRSASHQHGNVSFSGSIHLRLRHRSCANVPGSARYCARSTSLSQTPKQSHCICLPMTAYASWRFRGRNWSSIQCDISRNEAQTVPFGVDQ